MTNASFNTFTATMNEIGRLLVQAARYAANAVAAMSWPALLVCCIGLALLISILPLAIGLFLVFMVCKLAYNALDDRMTRGKATPHRPVADPAAPVDPLDKGE